MYVCNQLRNYSLFYTKDYLGIMPTDKHLKIFFNLCIALLINGFTYGQANDSLFVSKGASEVSFTKVTLDGKLFYRNDKTKEFISPSKYSYIAEAKNGKTLPDTNRIAHGQGDAYWQTDKVNPYRGVVLPTPYKITFDQTTFTHPVNGDIVVTSRFGRRRRGPHRGLDLDLVTGDTVRSVLPGIVRFVGYSRGHGKTVIVRHANDVETLYAHLSDYAVETNDLIYEGQLLGFGGNTGNSRGSHLHLEVRYKGVCIHPQYVFNFDGSQAIRGSELWVTNEWKTPRFHSSYRTSKVTPLFTETAAIAAQKAEPRYHRVRKGETLSHIAGRYSLRLREIYKLNTISKNAVLNIGQVIQVR